ncbi:MAG: FixH family protein [Pseudomonadota bacterium]
MSDKPAKGEFTGRHMAMVMIGGFGIVAAVNFTMATYAAGGFHGVVVENSYVASQKFNGWLEEAEASKALGWDAQLSRDADGHLIAATSNVPEGAVMSAELRRPLGEHEFASLTFARRADGTFRSTQALAPGRWTARLSIEAGADRWTSEQSLR